MMGRHLFVKNANRRDYSVELLQISIIQSTINKILLICKVLILHQIMSKRRIARRKLNYFFSVENEVSLCVGKWMLDAIKIAMYFLIINFRALFFTKGSRYVYQIIWSFFVKPDGEVLSSLLINP